MNTIIKNHYSLNKVKSSNFYSYAFYVDSMSDIKQILSKIQTDHPKAKHICYAYRFLEHNNIREFYYESTEPHGSSGYQIFNIMTIQNIVNCIIIVVREFSGTKLGLGLLTRSYSSSAKLVIDNNIKKYEEILKFNVSINNKTFEYFNKICWELDIEILSINYNGPLIDLVIKCSSETIQTLNKRIDLIEIKKANS